MLQSAEEHAALSPESMTWLLFRMINCSSQVEVRTADVLTKVSRGLMSGWNPRTDKERLYERGSTGTTVPALSLDYLRLLVK